LAVKFGLSLYVVEGMAVRSHGRRGITYRETVTLSWNRGVSVAVVIKDTGWTTRGQWFDARLRYSFFSSVQRSKWNLGPIQLPVQWMQEAPGPK